jgi:hypothetical protein
MYMFPCCLSATEGEARRVAPKRKRSDADEVEDLLADQERADAAAADDEEKMAEDGRGGTAAAARRPSASSGNKTAKVPGTAVLTAPHEAAVNGLLELTAATGTRLRNPTAKGQSHRLDRVAAAAAAARKQK